MVSFRNTILAITALLPLAQALTVFTPATLTECIPAAITWSGATSPVYVSILKGGDTADAALEQLGQVPSGNTATWRVDLPAGTAVTIAVTDATGATQYSDQVTIMNGTSTSCMAGASSSSTSSSATSSSSSSSSSASAAAASATHTSAGSSTIQAGAQFIAVASTVAATWTLLV